MNLIQNKLGISVLVTAHGEAPFLISALNSINSQICTLKVEVILVLDHASDNLITAIENFHCEFPLIIVKHDNYSYPAGLNLGISRAAYEYVALLDCDDEMLQNRLSLQSTFLIDNPSVGAVGSNFQVINEQGLEVNLVKMPKLIPKNSGRFWNSSPLAHSSAMFRRNAAISLGGYREFFKYSEDFDLWLRFSKIFEIANIQEPLIKYRLHSNQITTVKVKEMAWAKIAASESARIRLSSNQQPPESYPSIEAWKVEMKYNRSIRLQVWAQTIVNTLGASFKHNKISYKWIERIALLILTPNFYIKRFKLKTFSEKRRK